MNWFPQNDNALHMEHGEKGDRGFNRKWLVFFNRVYSRLSGVDSVEQVSTTVASVGAAYSQTEVNNIVSAVNAQTEKINAILAALQK